MSLYGKEKIWFLVNRLQDEREVTPDDELIGLHPIQDLNNHYTHPDVIGILNKLEGQNVAKLINLPTDQTYLKYQVELLSGFDEYLETLEEDPEYLEWSGKKPKRKLGYFNKNNQVDFTKTSEENKDKYISIGQLQKFEAMPVEKRNKIIAQSLTDKHRKDIEDFKKTSAELVKNLAKNLHINIPKLKPTLVDVDFALPPNYEAQQVHLLKQLVEQQKDADRKTNEHQKDVAIIYTKSRQVLLNGTFQLSNPTFNGENDTVFGFLFENPNKSFSKKQIEDKTNIKITKPLHKIVENLGFKGDLAKIFFSVSKNNIIFKNPVKQSELEQMGLSIIKL